MRILKYLLLALVLVAVAMVSALTAMRLAIHGREVTVPDLVGMQPAPAARATLAIGLALVVENRFYSSQVPEGRIVSQAPAAGTLVRRGWRVRVAESLGPQRVSIPDVVGDSGRAAEINLRRRGLDVGAEAVARIPDVPSDQVVAQDPPANASGVSSPRINLLVSAPAEPTALVMPNFIGKHSDEAIRSIRDAGLRLAELKPVTSTSEPPDIIVRQSPPPGQKVTPGTGVTFDVVR